jgi:hypothetical protein
VCFCCAPKALRRKGLSGVAFERDLDSVNFDFMTPLGYSNCLSLGLQLVDGGVSINAPVCSTWVFMCLSVTKRSAWRPLGDTSRECVADANAMVNRVLTWGLCYIVRDTDTPPHTACCLSPRRHMFTICFVMLSMLLGIQTVRSIWLVRETYKLSQTRQTL